MGKKGSALLYPLIPQPIDRQNSMLKAQYNGWAECHNISSKFAASTYPNGISLKQFWGNM